MLIYTLFTTWVAGRRRLATALAALSTPVAVFVREVGRKPASTIDGTAIFLTPHPEGIPFILRHHWLRSRVLREEVVLLTIVNHRRPYVDPAERVRIEQIVPRLTRITAHYGFMETPDVGDVWPAAGRRSRARSTSRTPTTSWPARGSSTTPGRARSPSGAAGCSAT